VCLYEILGMNLCFFVDLHNEVNLRIDFHRAHSQDTRNETVCIPGIHGTKLCAFKIQDESERSTKYAILP
jgi:hypothetical protein